jgi:hypothetical protein
MKTFLLVIVLVAYLTICDFKDFIFHKDQIIDADI